MVLPERGSKRSHSHSNSTLTSSGVPHEFQPVRKTTGSNQAQPLVKPDVLSATTRHPRPTIEPKPVKPAVKPMMISSTDLVGQILLQGFGQSTSDLSKNTDLNAVKPLKDAVPDSTKSTSKPRAAPCYLQVEQAQAEIKAKRQRLSQWLSVSIYIFILFSDERYL